MKEILFVISDSCKGQNEKQREKRNIVTVTMANSALRSHILKLSVYSTVLWIAVILSYKMWQKKTHAQLPIRGLDANRSDVKAYRQTTFKPLHVIPSPVKPRDLKSIERYHAEERRFCEQKIANRTDVNWCPCIPPDLHGRVFVNMADDSDWDRIADAVGSDVLAGGEWKPKHCVSHTRLAIVIPCRDREHHLRILLRHLIPILKRQLVHFRVFVVDQRFPAIFNKAVTMNIGFLEAAKRFSFDCVIFHDVDMMLEDDRTLMTCCSRPRHYARSVDRFDYKWYPTFGGVVSVEPELFRRVNGYPLKYFGWGGEDDEMWGRLTHVSSIYGPPNVIARYSTVPHVRDPTNQKVYKGPSFHKVRLAKKSNSSHEGLSDLNYEVNDVQMSPLFTRIQADINITELTSYPSHPYSQYERSAGICLIYDVIKRLRDMSWISCKSLCDSIPIKKCIGFSYLPGICTIIRASCKLTLMENAWTYVKEGYGEQMNRPI